VMGRGKLDIRGASKLAWSRAAEGVPAASTTITLRQDPIGWRVGDEIVVTPTVPTTEADFSTAYDYATVRAVEGRVVTLSAPTKFAHPRIGIGGGLGPEVLNLTRNVRIEGRPGGRTHLFIRTSVPQSIRYSAIRFVGPRKSGQLVAGRYGLHFHLSGNAARGSLVDGVVIRDAGNHAFVPHTSHGITFRNCISHNTTEDAYWWDVPDDTDDVVYDRCVASLVQIPHGLEGFHTLSGFRLNRGRGLAALGCVAVGIQGGKNSNGYHWPSQANSSEGVWLFEDCVSHNNRSLGAYIWQNTSKIHPVTRMICYHNGISGILHGAYKNPYRYEECIFYGNGQFAIILHAVSTDEIPLRFVDVVCDQAGSSERCVATANHVFPPPIPTKFERCDFRGSATSAIGFFAENNADQIDFSDCTYAGNEFFLADSISASTYIRVFGPAVEGDGSIALRRSDQPGGELFPNWNAKVYDI
ncbi:MAG: hypothetical protein ACRDQ2_17015, partial [Gaiellales bacterium]